jgi:dinuclear metal center YbgI/SA1388 family protein
MNESVKLKEIIKVIELVAPPQLQENYDNSGLIVGSEESLICKALISLDCTEEIIQEAIDKGCNLVIAHHPIVFSGIKKLTGKNYVERTVIKAIKNDVAIYACHTNLDNVLQNGVNKKIADKLGLNNCSIMLPKIHTLLKLGVYIPKSHFNQVEQALFLAGAGQIGNYKDCGFSFEGIGTFTPTQGANPYTGVLEKRSEEVEIRLEVVFPNYRKSQVLDAMNQAHPYEEVAYDIVQLENARNDIGSGLVGYLPEELTLNQWVSHLKTSMQIDSLRLTRLKNENIAIKKVGICGGSGSFLIKQARAIGCDAFVSADIKYHEFFDGEGELLICDIGHYESEKYTSEIFKEVLSEKFPKFATLFAQIITNPVYYI